MTKNRETASKASGFVNLASNVLVDYGEDRGQKKMK
jgi:hypothetical protein